MNRLSAVLFTILALIFVSGSSLAESDNEQKRQPLTYDHPTFFVQDKDERADIMLTRVLDDAIISVKELAGSPGKIDVLDTIAGRMLREKSECTSRSKAYSVPYSDAAFVEVSCGDITVMVCWIPVNGHIYASIMTWPDYDKYDENMAYVFIRSLTAKK
jgi:hypothetical protein